MSEQIKCPGHEFIDVSTFAVPMMRRLRCQRCGVTTEEPLQMEHAANGVKGADTMHDPVKEIRLMMAQKCLDLAIDIAPLDCEDGIDLVRTVRDYCQRVIERAQRAPKS